jgi:small subunit ribosomal protein S1
VSESNESSGEPESAAEAALDVPATNGEAPAAAAPPRRVRNPALLRAFRSARPVEGKILRVVKGGYEVTVGRARGFCPHSQIDVQREDHPEQRVGQTHLFRITQVRRGGMDLVLSRRVVLEEDRAEEAKAVRATLVEGTLTQGRVVATAPFGAFVDLGAGVRGLVHISELAHARILRVEDAVKIDDTVRVKVLKVDEAQGRISLSLRQAEADPWADAGERFKPGQVLRGTLQRLTDFGAFVELAPGVEALAPASEMPPSSDGWRRDLEPGQARDWYVLSVDAPRRRITLTLSEGEPRPVVPGATLTARIQRVEKYGVFAWLGPGQVGLMPRALTGAPEGGDLSRSFAVGDTIDVSVLEVSEDGRRIRLARPGLEREERRPAAPAAERREPPRGRRQQPPPRPRDVPSAAQVSSQSEGAFGTHLADKLRDALSRARNG